MKIKSVTLLSVCALIMSLLQIQPAHAQDPEPKKSLIKRLLSSEKPKSRKGTLMALPALAASPEKGIEYGLVGNYTFYASPSDTGIRSSYSGLVGTLTTKGQSNIKLFSSIWTKGNLNHFLGDVGYKDYPFHFYGIGDDTQQKSKTFLLQKSFRINFEAERRVIENYYAGINFRFETFDFQYNPNEIAGPLDLNDYPAGKGGKYLSLGISQVYDNRNSITETTSGEYLKFKWAYAPDFWGGDNFRGAFLWLEARKFLPLRQDLTWGIHANYQAVYGRFTPYYLMPQLGNDEIMRGYYSGRFRDRNLLALQTELRYRFHPRFSAAGFLGAGTVFDRSVDAGSVKLAYGGGIRYFFNLQHETSIRLDLAQGQKRTGEKRPSGFYISLGQAF